MPPTSLFPHKARMFESAQMPRRLTARCQLLLTALSLLAGSGEGRAAEAAVPEKPSAVARDCAEAIARLEALGAVTLPMNGSPTLLAVYIRRDADGAGFCNKFIARDWTGSDADLSRMRGLRNIGSINLDLKVKNRRDLQFLTDLPHLKRLSDGLGTICDEDMSLVAQCPALEEFFTIYEITDLGLRRLADAPKLRDVVIFNGCPGFTDAGLESIGRLSHLERLCVGPTKVTDRGLRHLHSLPALRTLVIQGPLITDTGVETLGQIRSLRDVHLFGTKVSESGAATLRSLLPGCKVDLGPTEPSLAPKGPAAVRPEHGPEKVTGVRLEQGEKR